MCLSFFNSLDSLALLGHSINEVNIKRRELIKPDLNDQFKQRCGSHTQVTKLLFGDDLPKSVKEISETNKVGVKVSSEPTTHYNKQQKRSNFSYRTHQESQKPFLWKNQGPRRRSHLDLKHQLHFQVSLTNYIDHNRSGNVPYMYVAG